MSKPPRSTQDRRERFDRTDAAAIETIYAERVARFNKTQKLKLERLARERAEEQQKQPLSGSE